MDCPTVRVRSLLTCDCTANPRLGPRQIQKNFDSAIANEQTTATIKRHLANLLYPVPKTLIYRRGSQAQSGRQPLCLLHFEGTLNRYVAEEKF